MHPEPVPPVDDGAAPGPPTVSNDTSAPVIGTLSPSRAGDFVSCPLLYRFRTIDRIPEPPSEAASRGTLVHRVLELLFDLSPAERTPQRAEAMLRPAWEELCAQEPELADLFSPVATGADHDAAGAAALESWFATCSAALVRYFDLEDPRRLQPAEREAYVEAVTDSRLLIRGIIDRIDVAPDGAVRIVDYKTGRSPGEGFEASALFQLRFYALALWRTRGVVPAMLQLVYLGNGEMLRYQPDVEDLLATERKVEAIWQAIEHATLSGDWRPRPSALCGWCAHRALCPAQGGTAPPLPAEARVLPPVDPPSTRATPDDATPISAGG